MARLVVDPEGKVIIPPEIIQRQGLHPGDAVALVEVAEGLLVSQEEIDSATQSWWNSLSEEERLQAKAEAHRYEALSEEERDDLWNERSESIEENAEEDEIELPTQERPPR